VHKYVSEVHSQSLFYVEKINEGLSLQQIRTILRELHRNMAKHCACIQVLVKGITVVCVKTYTKVNAYLLQNIFGFFDITYFTLIA